MAKKKKEEPKVEEPKVVFIVVSNIKENGKRYAPGMRYDGKFPDIMLEGGQIRIED